MVSTLANRYARALFEVATTKDAVDAVAADLASLGQAFADTPLGAALEDPGVKRERREAMLHTAIGGDGANALTRNLIGVVIQRRREKLLADLPTAFRELVLASRNEVEGVIESARPLGDEQHAELEEIAGRLTGKTVRLTVREDASLLGGVRLRVGNTLYDGAVATALNELERRLMEAPIG